MLKFLAGWVAGVASAILCAEWVLRKLLIR